MIDISVGTSLNDGGCLECKLAFSRAEYTRDYPVVLVTFYHSQFRFCRSHYLEMLDS